ncbi:nicotinamidase-related amidase [Deinobacterium chartae]|uniref:Nicotinamidase-related amidase n=1 Tax=Deinobacterium chartae TaxID=521158 RepID=A0A841HUZ2_9DEIO|nr:isochorismatase family cysteine hydrolase [Deinobacterium chartae]MBB6096643.1 nicotinamidase-related amidase [Deinobacterium chartae]
MAAALLLIDVIGDFEFEGSECLFPAALEAAPAIAEAARRARAAEVPVVYVNDNYGEWRSDFRQIVERARQGRGRVIAEQLLPREGDLFVLKPRNSGFHLTPLEALLAYLEVQTVVLAGFACDLCVLFTANDARTRGFDVAVLEDGVASERPEERDFALQLMKNKMHAQLIRSQDLDFSELDRPRR